MKIYLIPGLGFDHRIFSKLNLEEQNIQYFNWIEPLEHESIRKYAERLAEDIVDDGERTLLIGHSLGGILSQEIACFKQVGQIVLISSIKSRKELPAFLSW